MKSVSFKELYNLYSALFFFFFIVSPNIILQAFSNAAITDYSSFPKCFHICTFLLVNPVLGMFSSTIQFPLPLPHQIHPQQSCSFLTDQVKPHFLLHTSLDFTTHRSPYILPMGCVTLLLPQFLICIFCSL